MPNPPKPTELKRLQGNPGGRKLPKKSNVIALVQSPTTLTPPRTLGVEGLKLWNHIWEKGKGWISDNTDTHHVLLMCEAMDERQQLREQVLAGADWRDRVALRSIESQIISMLSALGLNPVERSRLGVAEVTAMSKLDQLAQSRNK
jgi:phage terminase small subunit